MIVIYSSNSGLITPVVDLCLLVLLHLGLVTRLRVSRLGCRVGWLVVHWRWLVHWSGRSVDWLAVSLLGVVVVVLSVVGGRGSLVFRVGGRSVVGWCRLVGWGRLVSLRRLVGWCLVLLRLVAWLLVASVVVGCLLAVLVAANEDSAEANENGGGDLGLDV